MSLEQIRRDMVELVIKPGIPEELIDENTKYYVCLLYTSYSCDCAFDGMTAADMFDENVYDLVLLDIMLPERCV